MKLLDFLRRQTNNEHHVIYSNNDEYLGIEFYNLQRGNERQREAW